MSILRRLSYELRQVMLHSNKQFSEPISVIASKRNSFWFDSTEKSHTVKTNYYMDFVKLNIHTSNVNKDIEHGIRTLGAGLAMVGSLGSGIGIGILFGNLMTGVARNPSLKGELFTMTLMGTAFCESISLFCFLVSMVIIFV